MSIQLGIGDEGVAQQTVEWAKSMIATIAPDSRHQKQRYHHRRRHERHEQQEKHRLQEHQKQQRLKDLQVQQQYEHRHRKSLVYQNSFPPGRAGPSSKLFSPEYATAHVLESPHRHKGSISVQLETPFKVAQKHLRKQVRYAEPARLRFWIRTLRAEVIREAAWNRHQELQLGQLRLIVAAQQRELVTSRLAIERLKGALVRATIDKEHLQDIRALTQKAITKVCTTSLHGENKNLVAETACLNKENETECV